MFAMVLDDEFLGRALVTIDDLRRLPSSRQIIPLTGRTSAMTTTSGSITAEVCLLLVIHLFIVMLKI
jgi:hypothetical protein